MAQHSPGDWVGYQQRGWGTVTMGRPTALDDGSKGKTPVDVPGAAALLSFLGAFFLFIGAGTEYAFPADPLFGWSGTTPQHLGLVGFVLAVVVVLGGISLLTAPAYRVGTGGVLVIAAGASIFTSLWGGFVMGTLLSSGGGVLAIAWKWMEAREHVEVTDPELTSAPLSPSLAETDLELHYRG